MKYLKFKEKKALLVMLEMFFLLKTIWLPTLAHIAVYNNSVQMPIVFIVIFCFSQHLTQLPYFQTHTALAYKHQSSIVHCFLLRTLLLY